MAALYSQLLFARADLNCELQKVKIWIDNKEMKTSKIRDHCSDNLKHKKYHELEEIKKAYGDIGEST